MRYSIPGVVVALLLTTGTASAFGGAVNFPTLTWPVTPQAPITTPAPVPPLAPCTDLDGTDPGQCPAPSR